MRMEESIFFRPFSTLLKNRPLPVAGSNLTNVLSRTNYLYYFFQSLFTNVFLLYINALILIYETFVVLK